VRLTPLDDYVVLEQVEAEKVSAGGILLPDSAQRRANEGVVIAVGRGRRLDSGRIVEPQLVPGQKVFFAPLGGTRFFHDEKDYVIIREDDIIAVRDE